MATNQKETVLVLRTVKADGTSHGGFQWPLEVDAVAEAPDWKPLGECGNGLHGLVNAEGNWSLLDWGFEAKALIVEVEKSTVIELNGKVKFPRAVVKQVTTLTAAICALACDGERIARRVAEMVAEIGTADAGNSSQLAASGDSSQLAASGDSSQLAASGYSSQLAVSGDYSQLAASGNSSKLAASGDYSQLAASGDYSQLAASGNSSKLAASGNSSKLAASGDYSTVIAAAPNCIAKTGANGAIALAWHDGDRPRIAVGYVGEGLNADTWYLLDKDGQFVEMSA